MLTEIFLHQHPDFADLIRIMAEQQGIDDPALVEKLQAISTKYRKQQEGGSFPRNFMRHYYDVYALLQEEAVQIFIDTPAYCKHKNKRFPVADNQTINENEAFMLSEPTIRKIYEQEYNKTPRLYHTTQPAFDDILALIHEWADKL